MQICWTLWYTYRHLPRYCYFLIFFCKINDRLALVMHKTDKKRMHIDDLCCICVYIKVKVKSRHSSGESSGIPSRESASVSIKCGNNVLYEVRFTYLLYILTCESVFIVFSHPYDRGSRRELK